MTTRITPQPSASSTWASDAQTAAKLTGNAGGDDGANAGAVDGPPLTGAVEIDEVQGFSALFDPAPRHSGGIGAEDGLAAIVALL